MAKITVVTDNFVIEPDDDQSLLISSCDNDDGSIRLQIAIDLPSSSCDGPRSRCYRAITLNRMQRKVLSELILGAT